MIDVTLEPWMLKLKQAVDAGYYRTEPAADNQTPFPWQNATCNSCPFWLNSVCRVHAEPRSGAAHTCGYFDEPNHRHARRIIEERLNEVRRMWWGHSGR